MNNTEIFTLLQKLFRDAAPHLLSRAGNEGYSLKNDGSPVTDIDRQVEATILDAVERLSPGVPIYGEESGYNEDECETCWLIDPIDGTKSFIDGTPTYTCMAVCIEKGEAILAIIYNPSTDAMFTAAKGKGAYKNGTKLDLSSVSLPNFAYCKGVHIGALNSILEPVGVRCRIAPSGGGHAFTEVAEGKAAARFQLHSRGYIHDYAPGALLVSEAGGSIIPISADYTYKSKSFIVCHPKLTGVLEQHIAGVRTLELTS